MTEASAFAFDHVGERLQRSLVGAGHGFATTAIIKQGIHGLLQHALFIAHDDVRRLQFQKTTQTVVTVDHPTIEVVQVGGGEASAIQRNERAQFGGQYRQNLEDHPIRLHPGLVKTFKHLESLGDFLDLGFRRGFRELGAQLFDFGLQIDLAQEFTNALGTHHGHKAITILLLLSKVVVFRHDLAALERGHVGMDHHKGFKVKHPFDVTKGHVENHAQT